MSHLPLEWVSLSVGYLLLYSMCMGRLFFVLAWCPSASLAFLLYAWLSVGLSNGMAAAAECSQVRTAALRARELAEVSLKVYEAGGKTIHVPLPPEHMLVLILKEVLAPSGTAATGAAAKEHAALRAGAMEVAEALLDGILQQQVGSVHCLVDGAQPVQRNWPCNWF